MRKAVTAMAALWTMTVGGCTGAQQAQEAAGPDVFVPVSQAVVVVRETTMEGGRGRTYGAVTFKDSPYGLIVTPRLRRLDPGPHAVHVHENASCAPDENGMPAGAAGDHYDPHGSGEHTGPYGEGHLGDLPNIIVEPNGMASLPVLAPRVTVADVKGRALMIHAGADRYIEYGEHKHGKGGMRMFCGIIK